MLPDRIILIGPSGSGKSHLGSLLAAEIGFELVDIDAVVESRIGMSIDEFFQRFGESTFRTIEADAIRDATSEPNRVIATGGGAVLSEANWSQFRPGSVIVGLTGSIDTLVGRVSRQEARLGRTAARPNMAGDPRAKMQAMLEARSVYYRRADVTIDTDDLAIDMVLKVVLEKIQDRTRRNLVPSVSIETPIERSDLYVHRGIRRELPELVRQRWPQATKLWMMSDDIVAEHWLAETVESGRAADYDVREVVFPAGESSKSFETYQRILEQMTLSGVSRTDVVVALGGGVVGDLAGFVAATCLRGLALVQLPTSLLAMVDSSVGGKTAINTSAGKNLVGAFYQPGLVLIDPDFLRTLSPEEYRSGMSEVIKHAFIQPATPLRTDSLDRQLAELASLDPIPIDRVDSVVLENVLTKHSVVVNDEREAGLRMILNFGHTTGHAIEAEGYRYRHGEAVALGMLVATHIGISLDLCDAGRFEMLETRLSAAGLPTRYDGEIGGVIANMKADKKNINGVQRWVLPVQDGGVAIRTGIDADLITAGLAAIGGR